MLRITDAYRVLNDCLVALAFFPDGRTLLSTTQEMDEEEGDLVGVMKVWQRGGGVRYSFRDVTFAGTAAVSDGGRWVAWGGITGQIGMLLDATGQLEVIKLTTICDNSASIRPLVFLPRSVVLVWKYVGMARAQLLEGV
jgi:hypothetical protein